MKKNYSVNDIDALLSYLPHLRRLSITNKQTTFLEIMTILQKIPNVHTLTVACPSLAAKDIGSFQENEAYRRISKQNQIRKMTFTNDYTLRMIQMLADLFPRLQHLSLNTTQQSLEGIILFLLTNDNKTSSHVSSLCIIGVDQTSSRKMRFVVEFKKSVRDYSLKSVDNKLYLWW